MTFPLDELNALWDDVPGRFVPPGWGPIHWVLDRGADRFCGTVPGRVRRRMSEFWALRGAKRSGTLSPAGREKYEELRALL